MTFFSGIQCTSFLSASMHLALSSRSPSDIARVEGLPCVHVRSRCKGICEWVLTMRVSANATCFTRRKY
jgi:hypothetical protein